MQSLDEKQLDEILQMRVQPQSPEGLSERIVATAHQRKYEEQNKRPVHRVGVWERISGTIEALIASPKPIFATVVFVFVVSGLFVGMNGQTPYSKRSNVTVQQVSGTSGDSVDDVSAYVFVYELWDVEDTL